MANTIEIVVRQTNKGDALKVTTKEIDDLGKSAKDSTGIMDGFGSTLTNVGIIAGGAALAGVVALGAGLSAFAIDGIAGAIELDQQMANIAATMGMTAEQTEGLRELTMSLALNPELTVSATQAAEAIEVLAANGAELTDEFGNVTAAGEALTTQVVAMSNATGADFPTSAAIATDAMNLFGLSAEEMGKAVDGAAGVMIASKFDAEDYALALANAGGIAAAMGVEIEDFNTVIAGTASQFSSGSDAGTSFKTMLQRLAAPTAENKELMDQLGISLFDTSGEMRPMTDIVGQLHQAFDGLTEAEKAELAAKLGGADASRTLLALAEMSEEQFASLSDQVNETGLGMEAAATRTNTVSGQFDILGGIIEAVSLEVGNAFLPIIKDLTAALIALATDSSPVVIAFFEALAVQITEGIATIQLYIPVILELGEQFVVSFNDAMIAINAFWLQVQPILSELQIWLSTNIPLAVDATIVAIDNVVLAFEQFGLQGAIITAVGETFGLSSDQMVLGMASVEEALITMQAAWETGLVIIEAVINGIVQATGPAFEDLGIAITEAGVLFSELGITWEDVGYALLEATEIVFAGIGVAILAVLSIITGLVTGVTEAVAFVIASWDELYNAILTYTTGITELITGLIMVFQGDFVGGIELAFEGSIQMVEGSFAIIYGLFNTSFGAILELLSGFVEGVIGFWDGLYQTLVGGSIVPDMINEIIAWFTYLPEQVLGIVEDMATEVANLFESMTAGLFGSEEAAVTPALDTSGLDTSALAFDTGPMNDGLVIVQANLDLITAKITTIHTVDLILLNAGFTTFVATATTTLTGLTIGPLTVFITTLATLYQLHIPTLMTTFTAFITTATTELITLTVGPLTTFITTLATIYQIHLPALVSAWISSTAAITSQIAATVSDLASLQAAINETQAVAEAMTGAIVSGMKEVAESIEEAAEQITSDLVPAIKAATKEFERMEAAANRAAQASDSAGQASSNAGGIGFQHGTGPGGFLVPSGFPNDSFLARLTSGERMFVYPPGQGPETNRQTVTNYYFNQTVNTRADQSTVIGDFRTMQMLLGV